MKPELEFSLLTRNLLPSTSGQIEDIEPLLSFLYNTWWRVDLEGLDNFPAEGPALIVGNMNGPFPWSAFMLIYALTHSDTINCPLHTLIQLDLTDDAKLSRVLTRTGFEPWSAERLEELLASGEVVLVFPEKSNGEFKSSARHRLREFDPSIIAPALSLNVPLFPLVTLGCDAKRPFLSWISFPYSLVASLPSKGYMRLLESIQAPAAGYFMDKSKSDKEHMSDLLQGTIQAELNRLMRLFSNWR